MDADRELSFAALAPGGGAHTLAYWLGPCDVAAARVADAVGISRSMSYQYDVEEQADRTGTVLPVGIEHFVPVAPVQLTRGWSPLPYAIDRLGRPDWTSVEHDGLNVHAAACAWTSARFDGVAPPDGPPDRLRFHRLLAVATMRAQDNGWGVLVVAKPGWSYDHAAVSAETARLMRAAGFVVQDRHE